MASSSSSENKITLVSSDNQMFYVAESTASMSQTVRNLMEDDCASDKIPLPNVDSATLAKVIEFCNRHAGGDVAANVAQDNSESLKKFDDEYVKEVEKDQKMLFDLILAANYLHIKELLDLLCEAVANMMRGKTPEKIREIFHIINDYTPEEEAEVRKENSWAFE